MANPIATALYNAINVQLLTRLERLEWKEAAQNDNATDHNGNLPVPPELVLGTIAYIEKLEEEVMALRNFKAMTDAGHDLVRQSPSRF